MKFGIIVFPGSNCDHDCYYVIKKVLEQEVEFIWHKDRKIEGFDCLILPGGFSYGDYLRAGAMARFSPVMEAVKEFADKGGWVLGICNGFQILLEAGLLPGAMMRNKTLKFICKDVLLKVENMNTPFTNKIPEHRLVRMPIAHAEGNYFVQGEILAKLEKNRQIVFRYCDAHGKATESANPNGSLGNIAGIINERGNVLGMMPHPERCSEKALGNEDGRLIFESILSSLS